MLKRSSESSPLSKNSKDDMSYYTKSNILKNINKYSLYLVEIFKKQYLINKDNNTSYIRRIIKKFNLSTDNTPNRYDKHLTLLLSILYLVSLITFTQDINKIQNIHEFINYLSSIVSYLESADITGWYHSHKHNDGKTYTDINNILYFIIAKEYLKVINQKTKVHCNDFYNNFISKNIKSKKITKYYVVHISNTHVKILLNKIIESLYISSGKRKYKSYSNT